MLNTSVGVDISMDELRSRHDAVLLAMGVYQARTLAVPGALTLAALIVVFGAIRPAIKAARPVPADEVEQGKLSAVVDDAQELPALPGSGMVLGPDGQPLAALEAPGADRRLESARALARGNPQAMANVVRGWMNN